MSKAKLAYLRDQDGDVAAFLDSLPNFSEWVRAKARGEMHRLRTGVDPELAAMIEQLLEIKLAGRVVAAGGGGCTIGEVLDELERFF